MSKSRVSREINEAWGKSVIFTDQPIISEAELVKEPSVPLGLKSLSVLLENTVMDETEVEKENNYANLAYFQSSLFATVLEDSITELRILVECNNELRIIKTMSDMKILLAKKFGVKLPLVLDELEGIDPKKLNCNEYKIYKLDSDRHYITEVLTITYIDLSINKNFKALKKCINIITALDDYRAALAEEEANNRATRRDLAKQLRQRRNYIKSTTYDTDIIINNLNTEVEDSILKSETQSRYIGNWQRARTEQHLQKIYDTEQVHSVQVEYYKKRSEHEQRVHAEAELLTNIMINETLEKVELWMDKYDKDMEALDLKIQIKKNEYYSVRDKRIGLEQTIQRHDDLMKMWVNFKEEREKARLYREKMNKSAITVQAWWRGLLVRLQLGPYKVAKKKGGKGKNKK
ncbi:hypothetical protein K1T71_010940 [Dendrolimus kikuchii]|uniref:Uncharacterized protein n=1 Tax=Dendrolimus kikuchii TaxID=765133 RepID=A0ACC1CQA9_9NEOP|nr:hypothetical protein K1T71_010940 [Dendrolimus kikuchii]